MLTCKQAHAKGRMPSYNETTRNYAIFGVLQGTTTSNEIMTDTRQYVKERKTLCVEA
jgi:hypothetical protein